MNRQSVTRALRWLRPLLINASLVTLSTLVAVLCAEVAVRLVAPQQLILIRPDLWQPVDTVGWLHRPNVRTQVNTGVGTVNVYTDSDGFRVGARGAVTEGRQVLLLGDSFMEALQVEYEESLPGLLEASLPERVGGPVGVRNAGVVGWAPDQYALRAKSLLRDGRYDLVIVAVALANDIQPQRRTYLPPRERVQRFHLRFPRSFSRTEFVDALLRPINDFLEERSHLFLFLRNRLQTVRSLLGLSDLVFPQYFLKSEADSPDWEVTAATLGSIDSLAAQVDVPTLFVLIPAAFQVDSGDLMHYVSGYGLDPDSIDLEQPDRYLGAALTARGLRVIDPLSTFRAAHDDGEALYGSFDPHFTPEGNRLLSSLVLPVAAELLANGRKPSERDLSQRE